MPRRLLILGSTGSIGTQALDVVARSGGELEVVGLSAERSWETLVEQAISLGVKRIVLADRDAGARASEAWTDGEVLVGPEGLVELVVSGGADLVLNALVGSAGLGPTVATLGEGIDLALANKESLVVGGELVTALAEATGAALIPVDSEHTALHQLMAGLPVGAVERLVITASGGPFRGRTRAELAEVSVEQALNHPTWAMGGKITIDSATLMNKGLEVMEAHHLFGTPYDRIDVVVHPQSIVHGVVDLIDGASLAHLGHPDMRIPIAYALHHPDLAPLPTRRLRLEEVGSLTFEPPDLDAFPCLRLARQAAVAGGTAPCVLNAANEIAVHAFLEGRLPFLGIAAVIEETLSSLGSQPIRAFETLYEADHEARDKAAEFVGELTVSSWVLAFLGFSALIILHEFGHFAAAKATGMRVEKFSLFFGPMLVKFRRGDTTYGIGPIPLGGYVKITGMNPAEDIPPEVIDRAYYRQPVWKRVVVIAGPAMNVLIAFLLIWALFAFIGVPNPDPQQMRIVDTIEKGSPAATALKSGDKVLSIDGKTDQTAFVNQVATHKCAGALTDGCKATTPATVVVRRDGETRTLRIYPVYDATSGIQRMRVGFSYTTPADYHAPKVTEGAGVAVTDSLDRMWFVTHSTVSAIGRIFYSSQARKQVSGVVGSYEATRQSFEFDTAQAIWVLALISLSLAVINLFPFLPLDGGHIFWAVAEKLRGRPISFQVMERAGMVGFALVACLFVLGLSNDIGHIADGGFQVR